MDLIKKALVSLRSAEKAINEVANMVAAIGKGSDVNPLSDSSDVLTAEFKDLAGRISNAYQTMFTTEAPAVVK